MGVFRFKSADDMLEGGENELRTNRGFKLVPSEEHKSRFRDENWLRIGRGSNNEEDEDEGLRSKPLLEVKVVSSNCLSSGNNNNNNDSSRWKSCRSFFGDDNLEEYWYDFTCADHQLCERHNSTLATNGSYEESWQPKGEQGCERRDWKTNQVNGWQQSKSVEQSKSVANLIVLSVQGEQNWRASIEDVEQKTAEAEEARGRVAPKQRPTTRDLQVNYDISLEQPIGSGANYLAETVSGRRRQSAARQRRRRRANGATRRRPTDAMAASRAICANDLSLSSPALVHGDQSEAAGQQVAAEASRPKCGKLTGASPSSETDEGARPNDRTSTQTKTTNITLNSADARQTKLVNVNRLASTDGCTAEAGNRLLSGEPRTCFNNGTGSQATAEACYKHQENSVSLNDDNASRDSVEECANDIHTLVAGRALPGCRLLSGWSGQRSGRGQSIIDTASQLDGSECDGLECDIVDQGAKPTVSVVFSNEQQQQQQQQQKGEKSFDYQASRALAKRVIGQTATNVSLGHCKLALAETNALQATIARQVSNTTNNNCSQSKTTNLATTNKLLGNFNSATNKFMDTCCSSWRQALHANSSGSYKVSQQLRDSLDLANLEQEVAGETGSLAAATSTAQQGESKWQRSQDVGSSMAANGNTRRVARFSRPGRSPVSLQRQTNARLTRHRLKIQQQRQDQLAQLALRERQRISQNHSRLQFQPNNNFGSQNDHYLADSIEQRSAREQSSSSQLINNILGTFSFANRSESFGLRDEPTIESQNHRNSLNRAKYNTRLAQGSLGRGQQEQTRVIIPTATRAIEICDNQLATSSRHQEAYLGGNQVGLETIGSRRRVGSDSDQARYSSGATNVIVYKSINMLRNGSSDLGESSRVLALDSIESDDAQTISSSDSSLSLNSPFCKICHLGTTKSGDKLISPCRCSGTMQYIHCGCLLKWLEISNRTNEKPISCELCAHEYTWHRKFNYRNFKLPKCSLKDTFLHLIFVAALGIMLFSVLAPMLSKKSPERSTAFTGDRASLPPTSTTSGSFGSEARRQHQHHSYGNSNQSATGRLAHDEKHVLLCAASFFVSFFLAIYVQTKARDTLYNLFSKFLTMNQTYYITEYDHGQLSCNANGINGRVNGGNSSKHQHDQQYGDNSRLDRKGSQQKS